MIQSFKIDNFRCYRSAELDDLRRINLVVGQNSSGKTALLEGLFLASGNSPEVALRLRLWRGMGSPVGLALDPSTADALWGDLFFQFNRKNPVAIVLRGTGEHNRTVRIEFIQRQQSTTLQHSDAPQPVTELPIRFNWKNARGENLYVVPELTPDGLRMGSIRAGPPAVFFHSAAAQAPQEVAGRFSTLSRRNEEQAVLEALQSEFSFVEGLSVELNAGLPMVYASVRNLRQKIPLGLVSSG